MTKTKEVTNQVSLTNEIADVIRERILKGEYKIGEKIKENQIAEELGVSRTPIRDAFKILEDEGLIDYVLNRGCFAKGFTARDIEDIYTVRESLETIAITWAVERITDEEIKALAEQCDLMEFYTNKGDTKKVLELNTSFHNIIYTAARSRFLAQVLMSYKEYLDKTRKTMMYTQEYLDGVLREHRKIYERIAARDTEGALKASRDHMEGSKQRAFASWKVQD